MRTLLTALLDLLLPERCALCDHDCSRGFCERCRRALPLIADPCGNCGLPAAAHVLCQPLEGIGDIVVPFLFAGGISTAIHALKYGRRRSTGRALGLAVVDAAGLRLPDVDALVPVPLHPSRLRERTFNQADELARVIGGRLRRPVIRGPVRRCRNTPAQATLTAPARRRNLANAFEVRRRLDSARLAIVDDVVTTGATVSALAAALAGAGAASVSVIAVARAVPAAAAAGNAAQALQTTSVTPPRKT